MTKRGSNNINPKKLMLSKWTAVAPNNKEKHFLVTRVIKDEQETITHCVLEAVKNHREIKLDWRLLKDPASWLLGWN